MSALPLAVGVAWVHKTAVDHRTAVWTRAHLVGPGTHLGGVRLEPVQYEPGLIPHRRIVPCAETVDHCLHVPSISTTRSPARRRQPCNYPAEC